MAFRWKTLTAALAVAAGFGLMASQANAAISYYEGTGTGAGSAVQNWISGNPGYHETASPSGVTGNGNINSPNSALVLPLFYSTTFSVWNRNPTTATIGVSSTTLGGTLSASTDYQQSAPNNIIMRNFSPAVTGFGFFLGETAQETNSYSVMITDVSGNHIYPVSPSNLQSTRTADFIGFSGLSGLTTVTLLCTNNGIAPAISCAPQVGQGNLIIGDFVESVVPEPASMALLGAGLFGIGVIRRRRRG